MELQEKAQPRLGLYLHVPFCARDCAYCGFYRAAPDRRALAGYLDAIERELAAEPPSRPVDTVFWGGGTPGLLPAADLHRLGAAMLRQLPAAPAEWTVEMAPATVKADKLQVLRDLGVNRISLGVQSFQPALLEALGRIHAPAQVLRAIDAIRAAGFANFNIDLIFAIPGQDLAAWERDLATATHLRPAHISTYCLTFEEDTALWLKLRAGQVRQQSEGDEAAFYERCWDVLGAAGYAQYEIANYALPGHACVHNLNTWRMQEWLGYGPSAASQFGNRRTTRSPDLAAWQAGVHAGRPARVEDILLTPRMLATDALVFGLRMNAGVDLAAWQARFGVQAPAPLQALFADLLADGLAERAGAVLRLSRAGRLLADRIGVEILERMEPPPGQRS
jgi:oxygen-independent coproporphyrinogen-3 oxidase